MNRTSEEPGSLEHPPGLENLTDDKLKGLGNNLELRGEVREVFLQCRSCPKTVEMRLRLPTGVTFSANVPFTCKECTGDPPAVDTPDKTSNEKGKERSRQWRTDHKEEAAEYKRHRRVGVSYIESRRELMSSAAWEAKLKEFGYICSTPGCDRALNLKTAIRWPQGPTYVPICARCRGSKAAKERWDKEKRPRGSP